MRGQSIFATGLVLELYLETCYTCGIPFAMPARVGNALANLRKKVKAEREAGKDAASG